MSIEVQIPTPLRPQTDGQDTIASNGATVQAVLADVIARFPADEREAMVGDDGVIRVDCAFCSSSFAIQPGEIA